MGLPGQHRQLALHETEMVEPFPRKVIIDDPVGRLGRSSQSSLDRDEDRIVLRKCTQMLCAVVTG
jgi:hypothetical protein